MNAMRLLAVCLLAAIPTTMFQNCTGPNATSEGSGEQSSILSFNVAPGDISMVPGAGAKFKIALSSPADTHITFNFQTSDDTAQAPAHYGSTSGSGYIAKGSSEAEFTVSTTATSGVDYQNKRFKVTVTFQDLRIPTVTFLAAFNAGPPGPGPGPTPGPTPTPAPTSASSNFGLLSVGTYATCAIKAGALYCWGYNGYGGLGNGSANNSATPLLVAGMETGVTGVSVGYHHACAIKNAALFCWGLNTNYSLGDGTAISSNFPKPVFNMDTDVTAVSAGVNNSCAIKGGALYCWGYNLYAQVGHNSGAQTVPYRVPQFESGVTAVSSAYYHTCAIKGGALSCWGLNSSGELAIGTFVTNNLRTPALLTPFPAIVGMETGMIKIASSGNHTCAIKSPSTNYCWGANGSGQLGTGNTAAASAPNSSLLLNTGVSHVGTGQHHTCAIKGGQIYCFGYNGYGQLGYGNTVGKLAPDVAVPLALNAGETVLSVEGGGQADTAPGHTCARTTAGRVFCWGYNGYGQLGNGVTAQSLVPVLVPGF